MPTAAATVVHLDTYHLPEYAPGGRDAAASRRLFCQLGGPSFRVVVTQTALGGAHAVLLRKCKDRARLMECIGRLHDALGMCRVDEVRCMPAFDPALTEIIDELRKRYRSLDGNDLLVLAQALADEDCKFLFTRDRKMIEQLIITEYEQRLRRDRRRRARLEVTYIL